MDETHHSEREARLTTVTPSELSSPSLAEESSGELRELVLQALRVAIDRDREGGSAGGSKEDLREILREICATARANELRAEALILRFKATWWHLPEAHDARRRDAEITLAGVITLCIKEYYAPASASTRRGVARPPNGRGDLHLT